MYIDQTLQFFMEEVQCEIDTLHPFLNFYDSFKYTRTGSNYTHPITWGLLVKVLWKLPGVRHIGVDMHLSTDPGAFRPDVVALESLEPLKPLLFLDYESPNSCDNRIPHKDVQAYHRWRHYKKRDVPYDVPYFIVTTLPCNPEGIWELRYTTNLNCKYNTQEQRDVLQRNPFEFWYCNWQRELKDIDLNGVYFFNLDGFSIHRVNPQEIKCPDANPSP